MIQTKSSYNRRKRRTRVSLRKHSTRPRLSICRSSRHISAQLIDDVRGITLAAASSLEVDMRKKEISPKDLAKEVGKLVAIRAVAAGVAEVVFDRGGFLYHGRVASLADGAREGGLKF